MMMHKAHLCVPLSLLPLGARFIYPGYKGIPKMHGKVLLLLWLSLLPLQLLPGVGSQGEEAGPVSLTTLCNGELNVVRVRAALRLATPDDLTPFEALSGGLGPRGMGRGQGEGSRGKRAAEGGGDGYCRAHFVPELPETLGFLVVVANRLPTLRDHCRAYDILLKIAGALLSLPPSSPVPLPLSTLDGFQTDGRRRPASAASASSPSIWSWG